MTPEPRRRFHLVRLFTDPVVLAILFALFIGFVLGAWSAHLRTGERDIFAWLGSFLENAGTELFGAFLTFLLIEVLVARRRELAGESKSTAQRKAALIRQVGVQTTILPHDLRRLAIISRH